MSRQIFFLIIVLINSTVFSANSQSSSDDKNICLEVVLKYDVELMKTPAASIERGTVLDHETKLSTQHYDTLAEVFKNCGKFENTMVTGVATRGPLAYSGPVIQRQMAARRIQFFGDWAKKKGISAAKINIGTANSEEPSPASLVLTFSRLRPVESIIPTADDVLPEVEASPCSTSEQFAFSADYDAEAARQTLSAHLAECGAVPGIAFQLSFEDLSEERMADWSAWNEMFMEIQNSIQAEKPQAEGAETQESQAEEAETEKPQAEEAETEESQAEGAETEKPQAE